MKAVPQMIADNARGGASFIHVVDIFPRGSDTWSQLRWADKEIAVGGNLYESGYIESVGQPRNKARIETQGGAMTRDSITLALANRNNLHKTLQQYEIEGRDIRVRLAMYPTNLIRNSSFEGFSGSDIEYWTETPGHASNTVDVTASYSTHANYSALLAKATDPAPTLQCDTFKIPREAPLSVSFDVRAVSGTATIRIYVIIDGKYWTGSSLQASAVGLNYPGIGTTFQRIEIVGAYGATHVWSADMVDCSIIFEVPNTGESVAIDSVMAEARPTPNAYHAHRMDMTDADLYSIYYGEVREHSWDLDRIKVNTKSILHRRHRDIPTTMITAEIDSDWDIPQNVLGTPFPMTYGDFSAEPQTGTKWRPANTVAVAVLVNRTQGTPGEIIGYVDAPGTQLVEMGRVFHFIEGSSIWVPELYDDKTTPTFVDLEWVKDANNAKISSDEDSGYLIAGRFAISIYLRGREWIFNTYMDPSGGTYFSNPGSALDGNGASYALYQGDGVSRTVRIYANMESVSMDSEAELIAVYMLGSCQLNWDATFKVGARYGSPLGYAHLQTFLTGPGVASPYSKINNVPWDATTPNTAGAKETDFKISLSDLERTVEYWLAAEQPVGLVQTESTDGDLYVYEFGHRVDTSIALDDALLGVACKGRAFDDTWGGRKTAANLIETPNDICEGIGRQELLVAGSDFNTAAYDAVGTARSTWKMAGQVTKITNSEKVFDAICSDAGLLYFTDNEGKESLAALDYGAAVVSLHRSDFVDGKVEIGYTPRENVINSYLLRYAYNPHSDEFLRTLYCNKDGQDIGDSSYATKCATSYAALGNYENYQEFESRWIVDDATAILLMKWLVNWNYRRRRTAKGELFLDRLGLEFGDRIGMVLPDYLIEADTDTPPIFFLNDYKPNKDAGVISVAFQEVLNPA